MHDNHGPASVEVNRIAEQENRDGAVTTRRDARGRFLPGHSGNPAGRPPGAGTSVREWINRMAEWTPAEVAEVATAGPGEVSIVQQIAARWLLRCNSEMTAKSGTPIAHAALEALFDRTIGKPSQSVEVQRHDRTEHVLEITEASLRRLQAMGEKHRTA